MLKLSFPIFAIVAAWPLTLHAWSESGHHLIALLAFEQLSIEDQDQLLELLAAHPRYAEDFTPPPKVRSADRFRVGTAGYWPDIARSQPKYDRPTWHYQLGATLTMGDPSGYKVPESPERCPPSATLETKNLHIAQAIELCRKVMADRNSFPRDRAIALCWIAHLVGDAHQPCHAGSLYASNIFRDGDRGANSIPTKQKNNLHALWDGLLGNNYSEGVMNRRVKWISSKPNYESLGKDIFSRPRTLDPLTWLEESREYSKQFTYTPEILGPVKACVESQMAELLRINLSEAYLKSAGNLAQQRAAEAGCRLAEVWREGLTGASFVSDPVDKIEPESDFTDKPTEPYARTVTPLSAAPLSAPKLTHWLNTNGNVRHNSSCRWFENTKHGRLCTADEGRSCGICGG